MSPKYTSYDQFWPFYLSQHANPTCRVLHFLGTNLVVLAIIWGIFVNPITFFLTPFLGYGFAWVGHFGFEKNKPATFKYPLWSLRADFHMWSYIWLRKLTFSTSRDSSVS